MKTKDELQNKINKLEKEIENKKIKMFKKRINISEKKYKSEETLENLSLLKENKFDLAMITTMFEEKEKANEILKRKLLQKNCSKFPTINNAKSIMMYKIKDQDLKYIIVKTIFTKCYYDLKSQVVFKHDTACFIMKDLFTLFDNKAAFNNKFYEILHDENNANIIVDDFLKIRFNGYEMVYKNNLEDKEYLENLDKLDEIFSKKDKKNFLSVLKKQTRKIDFSYDEKLFNEILELKNKLEEMKSNLETRIIKEKEEKFLKEKEMLLKKREEEPLSKIDYVILNNIDKSDKINTINLMVERIVDDKDNLVKDIHVKKVAKEDLMHVILSFLCSYVYDVFLGKIEPEIGSAIEVIQDAFNKKKTKAIYDEFDNIFKDKEMVYLFARDFIDLKWYSKEKKDFKKENENDANFNSMLIFVENYIERKKSFE